MTKKVQKAIIAVLLLIVGITALKILMVGFDIDEQYAFALSYRLLKGDLPLKDMWEPHQTSAFLLALIMLPYYKLVGSTGIVLFSRIISMLIHGGLMFYLWSYLKKKVSPVTALATTAIVCFSLPKIMFLAEFSNILMWSLLFSILSLLKYCELEDESKLADEGKARAKGYLLLLLAGIGFVFGVMAYPSTLLLFFVYLVVLIRNKKTGKRLALEIVCLLVPCVVAAFIVMIPLFAQMSISEMVESAKAVLNDGSHSASVLEKLLLHWDSLKTLLLFAAIYLAAAVPVGLILRIKAKEEKFINLYLLSFGFVTLAGQVVVWIALRKYPNYPLVEYFFLPIVLAILLIVGRSKRANGQPNARSDGQSDVRVNERVNELLLWFVVPIVSFVCICILSNHPFLVSGPFLAYVVVGLVVLSKDREWIKAKGLCKIFLLFWAFAICFGHVYMIRVSEGEHLTCFNNLDLIRKGPATGIVADPGVVWNESELRGLACGSIPQGSKVLYMGSYNSIYLAGDYEVCAPNVISTPTYNELMLDYYEKNKDKVPEYIICESSYLDEMKELFGTENYEELTNNGQTVVYRKR